MEEPYSYLPLPSRTSIRLLRVHRKTDFQQLECTLKTVDLEDAPSFHALSYTWGNPHAKARDSHHFTYLYNALDAEYMYPSAGIPVRCDGKRLLISRNLYDALRDVPADAWKRFINRRNDKGWTRLHTLTIAGEIAQVKALLASGVTLDTQDHRGMTALIWAVRLRHAEIVNLLMIAGARVDIEDHDGKAAMNYALEVNDCLITDYLATKTSSLDAEHPRLQEDGPEVWMWVDQMCINQADQDERSAQVDLMHRIYQDAGFTLVWLGREDSYTKQAADLIPRFTKSGNNFIKSSIIPFTQNSRELHETENIPYVSQEEWDAFAALFQRQYFRRLWIIQEVVLSHTVMMYCGAVEIPWRLFCIAGQMTHYRQQILSSAFSAKYVSLEEGDISIGHRAAQLLEWQDRFAPHHAPIENRRDASLANLMIDIWSFLATDPRDKVYGIYGLLNKRDESGGNGSVRWRADYMKPVEQVFAEATKNIILESGDLWILSAVLDHSWRKVTTLPSWVPDYSLTWTNMMASHCNAAGQLSVPKPMITITDSWDVLLVQGLQLDSVLIVGSTTSGPGDHHQFFDPSWLELTLLVPSVYHRSGHSRCEALWRTACANKGPNGSRPAPESFGPEFSDLIAKMIVRAAWVEESDARKNPGSSYAPSLRCGIQRVSDILNEYPLAGLTRQGLELEFNDTSRNLSSQATQKLVFTLLKCRVLSMTEPDGPCYLPSLNHLLDMEKRLESKNEDPLAGILDSPQSEGTLTRMLQTTQGKRRLFVTRDRFLGLGPCGMREGDGIWVLPGAGAAFVLRAITDGVDDLCPRYKLLGEAYVHGIMDGEAVAGKEKDLKIISLV